MSIKSAVIQVEVKCDVSDQKDVPNDGLATIIGPHIQGIDKLISLLQNQQEHILSIRADWKDDLHNYNPSDILDYVDSKGGYDQLKAMVSASDLVNNRSMEKLNGDSAGTSKNKG